VDVERIRPLDDLDNLARHNFAASEVAELDTLTGEGRLTGFFNCWTRKEAYVKAIGDGLSCPLDSFEVTLAPGDAARIRRIERRHTGPFTRSIPWQASSLLRPCRRGTSRSSSAGSTANDRASPGRAGGEMAEEREDTTTYKVVVNHEEQYSIWPADRNNPLGWRDAGKSGSKDECLAYIKEVWTDMRPLSLRKQMDAAPR
jgi:MbtH protein